MVKLHRLSAALYRADDVQYLSRWGVQTSEYLEAWGRPSMKPRNFFILHIPERTAVNMSRVEFAKAIMSGRLMFSSRPVRRG